MQTTKKSISSASASLLVLAAMPIAYAQAPDEPTATEGANDARIEEIVVTGSRIARRDYVAESPIVSVSQEVIRSTGSVTLESTLNQLPQVVTSAGAAANTGGGQAQVSLRGLGTQRTLVLIDGRRMQPANADGSVDLNMIPPSIVESIEVITGGASAVYGSDAVTGVVNFKLRRDIQGIEISAQYGAAEEGDAQIQDYSFLAGGRFAEDRGGSYVAVNYSNRGSANLGDRLFFGRTGRSSSLPAGLLNVDATNLPTQAAVDGIFSGYGFAPGTASPTARLYFNTDGTLFLQRSANGPVNYRDGFTGPAQNQFIVGDRLVYDSVGSNYSQTPLKRLNIFTYTDYELTPSIDVFVQGQFADYEVTGLRPPNVSGSSSSFIPTTIPVTNPFIPDDLATLLASRSQPDAPFTIIKRVGEGIPIFQRWKYKVQQVLGGASGELPFREWTWSVHGSAGKTRRDESFIGYSNNAAINRLLGAPDGGASLCEGGFNPFGLHAMSQSCLNYVKRRTHSLTDIDIWGLEMNLQGGLFDLPAGEVRFAAGAGYRNSSFEFEPDGQIATGELAGFLPIQATNGTTDVREVYGELLVPLVQSAPLAHEVSLSLAYRFSDYDTIGGVSTYKADVGWRPVEMLRIRGGYSRAIRAPSVGELFAPESLSREGLGAPGGAGSGDACDVRSAYRAASNPNSDQVRALCLTQGMPTAIIDSYQNVETANPAITGGNPDLQEETADTYSIGAVLRSRSENPTFSNLSLSVDYYSISLDGSVGTVTSLLAMQRCFNSDGSNPSYDSANFYCGLISRSPADGSIAVIRNPLFNLGGYKTTGVDLGVDWLLPLSALGFEERNGELHLSTNINYLTSFEIQTLSGAPFFDYAGTIGNTQITRSGTARPEWKALTVLNYSVPRVDLGVNWRYLGEMENADNIGTDGTAPATEAVSYFDLNATYHVTDDIDLRAGVLNLADREPPVVNIDALGQSGTDATSYDIIGRRFFVQVQARF